MNIVFYLNQSDILICNNILTIHTSITFYLIKKINEQNSENKKLIPNNFAPGESNKVISFHGLKKKKK